MKMKEKSIKFERNIAIILIVAAILVCIPLGSLLSKPSTYRTTFASLDDKMEKVLSLTTACTIASSAISAAPDDFATPIATQLAEYIDYLLLIFSILLAEKYMLSFLGMLTFRIVIPAVILSEIPALRNLLGGVKGILRRISVFFLAIYLVIPVSMWISDIISATYDVSFDKTISAAEEVFQESEAEGDASIWSKVTGTISNVTNAVTHLPEKVSEMMNQFIQSIAVMIVTSCIIPLLVLSFFLWLVKQLTGYPVPILPRGNHGRGAPKDEHHREEKELLEV